MPNTFSAMLFRMNYIDRWGLMRNTRTESLAAHSLDTALLAHLLAHAAKTRYGAAVDPERVACCALYHDAGEILTGDMPTPVKYSDESLRTEYKRVEREAEQRLAALLPEDLAQGISPFLTQDGLNERERAIVKTADKLSALLKCMEEEQAGNREFRSAKESTLAALRENPQPETRWFLDECLPAYTMTLDELMGKGGASC